MRKIIVLFVMLFIANWMQANVKKALIFGINGQDGCFLSVLLHKKGYEVYGVLKNEKAYVNNLKMIFQNNSINYQDIQLHIADLSDDVKIKQIISDILPDEIYNLAAQSNIDISFQEPYQTSKINILGSLAIFEAVRNLRSSKSIKILHASTVEIFGMMQANCNESTPYSAISPYGETKIFAQKMAEFYRNHYGLFISSAILSNHESSLRPENFTTRKITKAVAEYHLGKRDYITVGNIDLVRDWGFAGDFIEAMWLMLQQDIASDFIVATGESHSVKEFIERAFQEIDVKIEWKDMDNERAGYDVASGKKIVLIANNHLRPIDVPIRVGNPTKIFSQLDWRPKMAFNEIIAQMVRDDINLLKNQI